MNHTYVYLPSNSNSENTTTEYTTQFSEPIYLKSNSKVALVEVIYKHSWNVSIGYILYSYDNNITHLHEIKSFRDSETVDSLIKRTNESIKIMILKKIYNERFFERQKEIKLSEELKKKDPNLVYNFKNDKMYPFFNYDTYKEERIIQEIKNEKEYIYAPYFTTNNHLLILNLSEFFPGTIQFYGTIVKALEFEDTSFKSKVFKHIPNSIIYASNSLNLNSPVDVIGKLYIYAPDLIQYQFVGNIKTPLLGICVVEPNSFNKTLKINFDPPHYLDVRQQTLTSIKISIKDEFGNKILFDDSNIILKLDFI
jgi:hypothetical protein